MKISTRTRYGTRLMLELALFYGEKAVMLKNIAKREEISEKYLSQIIIPLKSAGLIESFRGAHGGYRLARNPKSITLKDIVAILEENFILAECVSNPSRCTRNAICITRDLWRLIGENIAKTLASITLDDLVKQYRYKKETGVTYDI